jgi:hypothetical protein
VPYREGGLKVGINRKNFQAAGKSIWKMGQRSSLKISKKEFGFIPVSQWW